MTSLAAVSSYLPPEVTPITPYLEGVGLNPGQIKLYHRFYGFSKIRLASESSSTELMLAAANRLEELRGREHQVRYVVQARTIQLAAPYPRNPLHEVRDALGLKNATAFSLTQHACASGLLAVDLCGKLLAADGDPDALALILVGEKAFTPSAQVIADSAIMGESMAAVLVRAGGERDRMVGYATRTYGEFHSGPFLSPELMAAFDQLYAPALAEVIVAAVEHAGLAPSDVALVLPHNVNQMSWFRVAKAIGLPRDRILLDNLPELGHCFCADSFINYRTALGLGRLRPGDHYVMTSVGLGATFSAMAFRH
ncbi:3-oxoacyl-[acyl-carrier-protein] synthase III C-terminal domain-containing protein [Amycolatopsis anabasis]|uniref:3-oxoacyl-[acyl-carrier-protein] synthase III C-terminal domain-containing protein n=1 Tax=Amycolatopsis anabasis TaxID=1840409 RepID=UPI00131AD1EF|nr:3-oxoacyl-[acyl-carrier-protein] synthase III C-terminal domain-containing protein [Amycolatopsis anabasis]